MTTPEELESLLARREGRQVEFKAASETFSFDDLAKYCVAIANEGGGTLILGAREGRPARITGTRAFPQPERTEASLYERLGHRVYIEEIAYRGTRVLVFRIPARTPGVAWPDRGTYWMRSGDALVPMSDEQLRRIHAETLPDFSAEVCGEAGLHDLDPNAVEILRRLWLRKAAPSGIAEAPPQRLLTAAELMVSGRLTYAALILLGTREALTRYLPQAETLFEYRSSDAPGPAGERLEFRQGFLPVLDEIWRRIDLRNDLQHFQQGLFVWDVPTFDERAVREGVLNALTHRDYRHNGSVIIRQYPRRLEIISPGGFPPGISKENVLWEHNPRNRRLAEVLARCGLVERAGQGIDVMYRACIQQSKPLPDFSRSREHSVCLTLNGEIQDPEFLRFLEEIGRERLATFGIEDFLVLDLVHREQAVPSHLAPRLSALAEVGVLELVGRGRGARYLLSRRFYRFLGRSGVYTRRRGLDRRTNKALLLKHIQEAGDTGATFQELQQVLPALSRHQIQSLLRELKREKQVAVRGRTRGARWHLP